MTPCLNPIRKLNVVHVAVQAAPFEKSRGLSQIAGMVPTALTSLGIKTSLVLPFFPLVENYLQKKPANLEEIGLIKTKFGQLKTEQAKFSVIKINQEPPIYLIKNPNIFYKEPIYGWECDTLTFSYFSHAVMELQKNLDEKPDIFHCHDWPTAMLPYYLAERRFQNSFGNFPTSDRFFENTRSVFSVYDFAHVGVASPPSFHQAAAGWERSLPGFAEFYDQLHLLKVGLQTSDLSLAYTEEYLRMVEEGKYGLANYDGIIRPLLASGKIVGLYQKNSEFWPPSEDLTAEKAQEIACRYIAAYHSLVRTPFAGMHSAKQTSPKLNGIITPEKEFWEIYNTLSEEEKKLITQALDRGEGWRFTKVKSSEEIRDILSFVKIQPTVSLEKLLEEKKLKDFLAVFELKDLERLLSLKIELKKCKALLSFLPKNYPEKEISLFDAFSFLKQTEETNLLDHVLNTLKTISLIAAIPRKSEEELIKELEGKGEAIEGEELTLATTELRELAEKLHSIKIYGFYVPFLLGVLLHDLGKVIGHDAHSYCGEKLIEELSEIRGLVGKEGAEFVKTIVGNHSLLGDISIREQDPEDLREFFGKFPDKKLRETISKCLFLLSIADIDAIGKTGKLNLKNIREVRKIYEAIIYAKDEDELIEKLEELGFSERAEGYNRFKRWVVGHQKENKDKTIKKATEELYKHFQEIISKEISSHRGLLAIFKNRDKEILTLSARLRNAFFKKLGVIKNIRQIDALTKKINQKRLDNLKISFPPEILRTRLIIWLVDFSNKNEEYENIVFNIKEEEAINKLCLLLSEFDLEKITNSFLIEKEDKTAKISVK